MDKYQSAIAEYELARINIKRLTNCIGELRTHEECTSIKNNLTSCIERYWKANTEYKYQKECVDYYEDPVKEVVHLCTVCTNLDKLIQERKIAKQRFGIAKRRLSILGKGVVNELVDNLLNKAV